MEAAIWILTLLFVFFVAVGAYAALKLLAAAKRGVDRRVVQARRTAEDTVLRAKQFSHPGVVGELARLRVALRTSMRATQDALRAAAPEDSSLSEALSLFERLSVHGHELDDELKRLEREPDKDRIVARLPKLRERTERITHSADSLRWASQDRLRQFADDELVSLGRQIEVEAKALRYWTSETEPAPEERPGRTQPGQVPSGRIRPGKTQPDSELGQHPAVTREPPPAITAHDPRTPAPYPWRKAPRPEGMT